MQKGVGKQAGPIVVGGGYDPVLWLWLLLGQKRVLRHLGSHQGMEKPKCQSQTFKTGRDLRHYLD